MNTQQTNTLPTIGLIGLGNLGNEDGAKCGAKFADTLHVIYIEVTGLRSEWKGCAEIAVTLVQHACN